MSHADRPATALPTVVLLTKALVTMRTIGPSAAVAIGAAFCAAVASAAADEAKPSNWTPDLFAVAFGKLVDRMAAEERSRPGAAARSAAGEGGAGLGSYQRSAGTEDLEAALERLKATDRIGLHDAYELGPSEDSLGLRIPLSEKTAIVPSYDVDHRDVGMAGTDSDRGHRFRIGASWRF